MFFSVSGSAQGVAAPASDTIPYHSPYSVKFSFPADILLGDITNGSRGDVALESELAPEEWDSAYVRRRYGSWGPPRRHYPPPARMREYGPEWQRERVIAVAMRFIGYDYQHHHIPDWTPPADWKWKAVRAGRNGRGIDCSNFASFVYDLALGMQINSDVRVMGNVTRIEMAGYPAWTPLRIEHPGSYAALMGMLQPGDLLFLVKNGVAYHVFIWLGRLGCAPNSVPLVIDSTDSRQRDAAGVIIPGGVHIREFREDSGYFRNFGHALRLIRD